MDTNNEKLNNDFKMSVSFAKDVLQWEESCINQLNGLTDPIKKKEFVDWLWTEMEVTDLGK